MGKRDPSAMRKTFGVSPTPNQTITRGTSPRTGTARNAWMTGSMRSSPTQNRPHRTARSTPAPTPITSPSVTRWSEMSRLDWSTPWPASSRPASNTATGEATSKLVNSPREQASCHTPMAASGPMASRASRGTRLMASRRRLPCAGRTSVNSPETTMTWSAILRNLLQDGVVPGRLGRVVESGHAVRRGEGPAAGHEVHHLLQGTLHRGIDGHVVDGPAGGEDQLRHLWRLVLDVDVVVGDPLGLVRLLP